MVLKQVAFILFLVIIISYPIHAQDNDLVDLSGIIMNQKKEPLPYSSIRIKRSGLTKQADNKGMFSLVAKKGDTISFSAFGCKKRKIVLPDTLSENNYYSDIIMFQDTIMIEPVTIFPWRNYEEFKQAILDLQLPEEKDAVFAQKNIEIIKYQALTSVSIDPDVNAGYVLRNNYNTMASKGMLYPTFSILNPFQWAKFIKALSDGSLQNSRDIKPLDDQ